MVSYLVAQSQDIKASAERVWGGLRGFATCWWQHCSRASSSASMRRFFGKRDMMRVKCFGEKQTKKETDTIWHSQCWILELLSDSNVSESLLGDLFLLVAAKRRRREEEVNMINHYQSPQGFQDCALIVTSPATTRHQYHHCYHQVPLKNPNVWSQNPPSNEPITPRLPWPSRTPDLLPVSNHIISNEHHHETRSPYWSLLLPVRTLSARSKANSKRNEHASHTRPSTRRSLMVTFIIFLHFSNLIGKWIRFESW